MIMKTYSYVSVNGYLCWVDEQSRRLLADLRSATTTVGGWDQAISDARLHREELDGALASDDNSTGGTGTGTPQSIPDVTMKTQLDGPSAVALRNRLLKASGPKATFPAPDAPSTPALPEPSFHPASKDDEVSAPVPAAPFVHPLVDHPNEQISALASEYSDMENELTGPQTRKLRWPDNITLWNFADYMLIPTLVYELEYPRTDKCVSHSFF
jgi:sterol O-acyltransferase